MLEKRFRVTLDFKTTVDDINEVNVRRDLKMFSNYQEIIKDPKSWEDAERQKRLLNALLKNEDALNQILVKRIVELKLEPTQTGEVHELLGIDKDEEEILEPVFAELNEEDAAFFRGAIEAGLFTENTEHIWNRFDEQLLEATMDEI